MFDGSLKMSFHALFCPSHLASNLNKHTTQYKTRSSPARAVQPSAVLLRTDKSSNSSESKRSSGSGLAPTNSQITSPLLSQASTVGIIGGVSAVSTLNFLEKLVAWSSKDGEVNLPFIVCNDPILSKELLSCERSSFPYLNVRHARSQLDHTPIVDNLRHKRVFLEQSGARCIVMPCHISHGWHSEISKDCSVPFLHVGDCVAQELKEAKMKPIEAGSNLQIGVLATDATLTAGFYQDKLQSQGFEVVLPDKDTMEHIVIPAIEALSRKDLEGARNLLRIALQVLLVRSVNVIVLASDDMRGLLPKDDPLLRKCVDPIDALARSTIKWAQSTEKLHETC
ncbi:broad specificity amino-acid racemase RacX [Telopea speciosissima]|uniref:broad specificity amino-acid racemase RacX n=1 Tax=Telopea speciosissima TaxID=54955 RepID=UPI001CC630EB|nr:broad specificity amino-acid racemase RacX [Telopea speciosissima]XP_043702262.1 broad specificity amino-acid racemase RacX [Telopea speciosissima]